MTATPLPTNITGLNSVATYMNTATDGWFWAGILITITIIMYLWMSSYGFKRASIVALFSSTMLCFILRIMELVNDYVLFTYGILTAIMLVVVWFSDE